MGNQTIELNPGELNQGTCLSCVYGENATGIPCYEGNRETWEKCDEEFSEYIKNNN